MYLSFRYLFIAVTPTNYNHNVRDWTIYKNENIYNYKHFSA